MKTSQVVGVGRTFFLSYHQCLASLFSIKAARGILCSSVRSRIEKSFFIRRIHASATKGSGPPLKCGGLTSLNYVMLWKMDLSAIWYSGAKGGQGLA